MKINKLFKEELKITNIGSPTFLKDLDLQKIEYVNLEWAPPAKGDKELIRVLSILDDKKELIQKANDEALSRIKKAEGKLIAVKKAIEVIPGMTNKTIMHAGPPISWGNMADPMKGAILGAAVFEGWVESIDKAEQYILSNDIQFIPNHQLNCVGPMAGITSPSMPVHVIYDSIHDNTSYCNINEGLGGVLRFGKNTSDVIERLIWIREKFAPVLNDAIQICDGIDVRNIIMQALNMGDECHNRNKAATSLFYKEVAVPIMKTNYSLSHKEEVLRFIQNNEHYFLNLSMPYCKVALMAGHNIKYSSLCTIMCRNAYEFGIKISSSDKWFVGPAQYVKGLYFPGYTEEDAALDLGDSAITETNGLGGFSMAASPSIVKFVGGTVNDAFNYSLLMNQITWGNNPNFTLPSLDFKPTAVGIDIIKVISSDILPIINTGIAHKKAGVGQVGAGLVNPPYECFKKALLEFAKQFD